MKKILSFVLAAIMTVGTMSFASVAVEEETPNQMLKFTDICEEDKGEGGDLGMMNYMGTGTSRNGFTIAMDFVYGGSGICNHLVDKTLKHQSKFAILLGETEKTYKYVGYSATDDVFFLGTCLNPPMYGEGSKGIQYLATSDTGLVTPGETYKVVYEFVGEYICNIYLDGVKILSFDLYEDLNPPMYFPGGNFMIFPTHMTCFMDNLAVYPVGVYNAETGEGADSAASFTTFDGDAQVVEEETKDAEGNVVIGEDGNPVMKKVLSTNDWQIINYPAYSLVNPENDVYAQPQYVAGEEDVNVIFQGGLDRRFEDRRDEFFAAGQDFNVKLTIKNNKGLDFLNDPLITVKSVKAADGLTAELGATDENGVTKLTITGDKYTGEDLAVITYAMSESAAQGNWFNYGARYTAEISGAEGMDSCIVTNGSSELFNCLTGDLNRDFAFDIQDVIIILQYAAQWKDLPYYKKAGDVNADGRTNVMDCTYYLKWIAKWKYEVTINGVTYY